MGVNIFVHCLPNAIAVSYFYEQIGCNASNRYNEKAEALTTQRQDQARWSILVIGFLCCKEIKWKLNHMLPVGNIDEVYEAVSKKQQNPLCGILSSSGLQ